MTDAWRRRRRLGESDCEEIRSGFIAQPVNALSSVAYVAGGGWVVAWSSCRAPAHVPIGLVKQRPCDAKPRLGRHLGVERDRGPDSHVEKAFSRPASATPRLV